MDSECHARNVSFLVLTSGVAKSISFLFSMSNADLLAEASSNKLIGNTYLHRQQYTVDSPAYPQRSRFFIERVDCCRGNDSQTEPTSDHHKGEFAVYALGKISISLCAGACCVVAFEEVAEVKRNVPPMQTTPHSPNPYL